MVPYTSFLLHTFGAHLKSFADSVNEENSALWATLIAALTKSLAYDDGGMFTSLVCSHRIPTTTCAGFWRDDKLRQISSPIIQQLPLCTRLPAEVDARTLFQQCLDAMMEDVSDDALLKSINLDILMHTRSENARIRHFALVCSGSLWRSHGGKLLGMSILALYIVHDS